MRENRKLGRKRVILMSIFTLMFLVAFMFSSYAILTRVATDLVINYTDELATHDKATINIFVSDRKKMLVSLCNKIRNENFDNMEDILREISAECAARDEVDRLVIIDTKGKLYKETGAEYSKDNNSVLPYFKDAEELFATRYYDEVRGEECMLYGLQFPQDPIVTTRNGEKIEIVGMAILNDISRIRERLRITCFNDRGYTCLVENDGAYIVPELNADGSAQDQNFYETLNKRKIEGTTVEAIREALERRESVPGFWCRTETGTRRWVTIYSFQDNANWNFVIALEESIFADQTTQFVQTLVMIFLILLLIISFVIFILYGMRMSLQNMYAGVSEGAHNRQYYEDKMAGLHVNALAIMDLDYLKHINDTFGHMAGDQAIKEIADVIVKFTAQKGEICRFGGDEFVVAFTKNLSSQEFDIMLENVRATVEGATFENYPDLKVTMSIGGYYGKGVTKDLLQNADALLYKAKLTRNAVITNTDVA